MSTFKRNIYLKGWLEINNNGKALEGMEESVSKKKSGQNNTQSLYSYQVCK